VILSWSDARPQHHVNRSASNVILHEFAHKLDMLNGVANGMPPLHRNMVREKWTASLSQAYLELDQQLKDHDHTVIDPYAAVNPAEFFAVFTEAFFEQPVILHRQYRQVYEQLRLYYRQDPVQRYRKSQG
jgi:Mlc titration factor MtfA (ptsG expression regulator)